MAETRLPYGQGLHKHGPDIPAGSLKRLEKMANQIAELGYDSRILADLISTKAYDTPDSPELSEHLLFATRFLMRMHDVLDAIKTDIDAMIWSEGGLQEKEAAS